MNIWQIHETQLIIIIGFSEISENVLQIDTMNILPSKLHYLNFPELFFSFFSVGEVGQRRID